MQVAPSLFKCGCVLGEFLQEHFRCVVCFLYAPNDQGDRLQTWNQLRSLKAYLNLPPLLMGDFNGRSKSNRKEGSISGNNEQERVRES